MKLPPSLQTLENRVFAKCPSDLRIEASDDISQALLRKIMNLRMDGNLKKDGVSFKVYNAAGSLFPAPTKGKKTSAAAETSTKEIIKGRTELVAPSGGGGMMAGEDLSALKRKNDAFRKKIKILRKKNKRRKANSKICRRRTNK